MLIYRCEDSVEGIFTAIYNSYEEKRDHRDTMLCLDEEWYLFAEYRKVAPDPEKTRKVIRTLLRRFGERDYEQLCMALSSPEPDKAQAVYRTVVSGLSGNCAAGHLFDDLADEYVLRAFKLGRGAGKEYDHLRGFLRFEELENGILYTGFASRNNLLTFLMPHFADRFSGENFVLHDDCRALYGVHPAGRDWYLIRDAEPAVAEETELCHAAEGTELRHAAEETELRFSAEELTYREMFRHFCRTITIEERRNPKLQRNMLPLRFREYMVEFD